MQLRRFKPGVYNPGNKVETRSEESISDVKFDVHHFTNRPKPNKERIVIFPCFSEFGCETLIPLYCIPSFLRYAYQGYYSIVVGWHGRSYFYKHLVDEFWEIKEEHQHLREYCRAFHHASKNLKNTEEMLKQYGKVVTAKELANVILYPKLLNCIREGCQGNIIQMDGGQQCMKCGMLYPAAGHFNDVKKAIKKATWLPTPSNEKLEKAKSYLGDRPIGLTARGRKCYGRNLSSKFYERLIYLLEDMGYSPVWLGEKISTQRCPVPHITDFTSSDLSRDLEFTLAMVSQLQFTVQFWTASTRLAGMMGVPFLLFESPDQLWGRGQEGLRLQLTSKGPKKIVASHFLSVAEDTSKALRITEEAILDMEDGDYSTVIGSVEYEPEVINLIHNNRLRLGGL